MIPLIRFHRARTLALMLMTLLGGLGWTTAALQDPQDDSAGMTPRLQQLMDRALGDSPFRRLFEEALEEGRPFPIPPGLMNNLMSTPDGQELLEEINRRFFDPRKHEPGRFEKQNAEQLRQFTPVLRRSPQAALAVLRDGRQAALATVVDPQGWLVSKASELQRDPAAEAPPSAVEPAAPTDAKLQLVVGQERLPVRIVAVDSRHDLALLKCDRDLPPPVWSDAEPQVGDLVVTPNAEGDVAAIGVVSVGARSLLNADKGFLGVQLDPQSAGAVVRDVVLDSAAEKAGLQIGDRILTVDGEPIVSLTHMINTISKRGAGETVKLQIQRAGREVDVNVVLGGRTISGEQARQFNLMSSLGSELSRRRGLFPSVLQHDSQMFPEMAGGPLLDLNGRVVAVNIARAGRVESYAIPAPTVLAVVKNLRESQ